MTWLSRHLHAGPYLFLAVSEKEYAKALKDLKVPQLEANAWIKTPQADATTHVFERSGGGLACVVCIRPNNRPAVEVCGLLVHEAVHVFQEHCKYVGESHPSSEFEAYSIQHLAQELIAAYGKKLTQPPGGKHDRPAAEEGHHQLPQEAAV